MHTASIAAFAACVLLVAGSARGDSSNLPPGWQWPPSASMLETGERCLEDLGGLGVDFHKVDRLRKRIATPIVVPSMTFGPLRLRSRHSRATWVMDCHLAKALAQTAWLFYAAGISEVRFSSIYVHRHARLGGRRTRLLSRHALGLGIDIEAVVDREGTVYSVYRGYDTPRSPWRRAVALLEASRLLRIVLSPDNESSHRDHVHISALMAIDGAIADSPIDHLALSAIASSPHKKRKHSHGTRAMRRRPCRMERRADRRKSRCS